MKRFSCLLVLCLLASYGWLTAQNNLFTPTSESAVPTFLNSGDPLPFSAYGRLSLDYEELRRQLEAVPAQGSASGSATVSIEVPTPSGELLSVRLEDAPVMHPELAARYPLIKSYRASTDYGTGQVAVSHKGFSGAIMGPEGEYFISPAVQESNVHHLIYNNSDIDGSLLGDDNQLSCGWDADQAYEDLLLHGLDRATVERNATGRSTQQGTSNMFQYDLALTCTGEFAQQKGGTLEDVMAAFNESVTLLNAILEREMAARFQLIANNDDLIYLLPNSDPYVQANNGGALLGQIQGVITNLNNIPLSSFDLGHLFTAGCSDVGGVVSGAACSPGKTRGVTCHGSNNLPFIVRRIMSHEVAHQFAVSHSWNNCPPSGGQRAGGSAFEPGSGSTIMSYAGTCENSNFPDPNNVQGDSDGYFHVHSVEQFLFYTRETVPGCATVLEPINNVPEITLPYEDGFFIPISTPFQLSGTATDADGDNLEYIWEQYDLGPARNLGNPLGSTPTFRSFPPSTSGSTRVFPRLNNLLNNSSTLVEVLPTYSRDLTFRLTARDNNPLGGAVAWETVAFRAAEEAGPFLVVYPNTPDVTLQGGDYVEITWDVANTDQTPVNCEAVNILLSTDGGQTYPITLADNAANTGSAFVTVPPELATNTARVRVEAANNIFFDLSNSNFSITPATEPGVIFEGPSFVSAVCLPEEVELNFTSAGYLGFDDPIELSVDQDQLPVGVTTTLSASSITPGESVSLSIDFPEGEIDGDVVITLLVTSGGNTLQRPILLQVYNRDFSDLGLLTPAEGDQSILLATPFDWSDAQYGDTYDIEIATSPDFAAENIFEASYGLTETEFLQGPFFVPNTIYYWRVRTNNECGPSEWLDPRSFKTASVDCNLYESMDTPQPLPGNGAFTRTSEILVDESGIINDVNVPNIDFIYQYVNKIRLVLESPAGTRVTLYDEDCGGFTTIFRSGFDDEAPNTTTCPPDDNIVFQPLESLSAFNGENTFGIWKLDVISSAAGGAPGNFASWEVEFCAAITSPAPVLVNNNTSDCEPWGNVLIAPNQLLSEDENWGPTNLIYTLVRAPLDGQVRLNGVTLAQGATFRQSDIAAQDLRYYNLDPDAAEDEFSFVVQNPTGGYIPVNYHRIIINGVTSVEENTVANDFTLFPNPTRDNIQLRWSESITEQLSVNLLDITGRSLLTHKIPLYTTNHSLSLADLPAGVYFLRIGTRTERIVKQ